MAGLPADLWSAFALLSRIPAPGHRPSGARGAWAWPLVGVVVGLAAGLAALAAAPAGPGVAAAMALAVQAALTGALHEDGLADCADGFWGGHTRDRRLEIMKDSRVGSFGVLALVLVVLAGWSAVSQAGRVLPVLVAAGALSRAPMAVLMAALPNAREGGLSRLVGRPPAAVAGAGVAVAVAVAVALCGWAGLRAALAVAVVALAVGLVARAKIGGQTGDVLGAAQQLGFVAAVAVLGAAQ
jgi:adenosylcobinamide-GDP ribazoletransferase